MISGGELFGANPSKLSGSGVASFAEPEINESGKEMQTSARSGGMQRPESPKVIQLPTFCEVEALKVLVL